MTMTGSKPKWLTFDCYGTLIQWDEGLLAAVETILAKQPGTAVDAKALIHIYDKHEHELEQVKPHQSFRTVAAQALRMAMEELGLSYAPAEIELLTPAFPGCRPIRKW
jgi:2-haloacid dehalogenase